MDERYTPGSYGQFCPVAMAAEVVCNRWTALILRELLCGSTRFNDLRRGVPLMSPTLLSKRLKELEEVGVIAAVPTRQSGVVEYKLTKMGEDLRPVIMSLGIWGQRWIESSLSLKNLDAIAAVDGVDGIFIGPNDLAADLGHLGNWQHPDVWKAMEDAAKRIRKAGKAPGILVGEADGKRCLDAGFLFVAVGADVGMLARGSDALAAKFK